MAVVRDPQQTLWRIDRKIQWRLSDKPTRPFELHIVEAQIGSKIIGSVLLVFWFGLIWTIPTPGLQISIIPLWLLLLLSPPVWWLSKRYYPWVSIALGPITFFALPVHVQQVVLLSAPFLFGLNWLLNRYWQLVVETAPGPRSERWIGYVQGPFKARKTLREVREFIHGYGVPERTANIFTRVY